MSYNGYRLKIEGVKVPNSYIAKGTFFQENQDRVLRQWTDATHTDHRDVATKKRLYITFSLRSHKSDEHAAFASLIAKREQVAVEFYDRQTDTYKNATCWIQAPAFNDENILGDKILFGETSVTITEY